MDLLHSTTLGHVLGEHRRSYPQGTALVCADTRLTYAELDARVTRLAHALADGGLGAGDSVLWLGQNCHRLLEAFLAAARLGAVFCPVNWRQSVGELEGVLSDLQPRVVVWQEAETGETARKAREAFEAGGGRALWIRHDGQGADDYEAVLAASATGELDSFVDAEAPVLAMYTAAFDGQPNGALLSHTAILTQSLVLSLLQRLDHEHVYLNCGPLFHIATFMTTMATFTMAGTNVMTPRVDAEELCRLIEAERCRGAFIVGPTVGQIVELNADGRYDLSSLRVGSTQNEAWAAMTSRADTPSARNPGGYGQTEVMGLLTFGGFGPPGAGRAGRPSPLAQVRIVDPEGDEVPVGEVGEIVARGPIVMQGYRGRPELNAERFRGGWHHTNDLGRREPDGTITFVGPKARLIKSAAENIYPAEVEAAIVSHPSVAACGVIGVPDERWVQSVKAIVVLAEGASATAEEIIEHCRERIASYKKPRFVEFATELPRKGPALDYDALDAAYGGGGYPGGSTRSV